MHKVFQMCGHIQKIVTFNKQVPIALSRGYLEVPRSRYQYLALVLLGHIQKIVTMNQQVPRTVSRRYLEVGACISHPKRQVPRSRCRYLDIGACLSVPSTCRQHPEDLHL
eukprot:3635272-Rhodomonas_salina.1